MLEPEFDLVGAVEDGQALLTAAKNLRPEVILLDISMPVLNGMDAAHQLRKTLPSAKLIFLTMHSDPDYVTETFRAVAAGYLPKARGRVRAAQRNPPSKRPLLREPTRDTQCSRASDDRFELRWQALGSPEPASTRSAPTCCRGKNPQRDRKRVEYFRKDGRVSQARHHHEPTIVLSDRGCPEFR